MNPNMRCVLRKKKKICLKRENKFLNIWKKQVIFKQEKIGLWGFQRFCDFINLALWGTFVTLISTRTKGDAREIYHLCPQVAFMLIKGQD